MATRATGEGTGEGGTPRSRRQGTRGDVVTRQGAGEGEWPWVHGLAGVPRDGIGIVGRCSPASRPTNRPTIPAAAIPGDGMMYPPLPAYPGMQPQAHMQQYQRAGRTALGAQEGKGEEHRSAWETLGEAERSLREREARVKGEVGAAEEGRTEGTDRPQGGEAQAVEELQRAWADLRRRQEGVERAEREGGRQEEGRGRKDAPLVPFRQPAIPPEQEGEMQERAWGRIRGEAARLTDRDREVAARERRVREEEEAVARWAHRVLPDPEGGHPLHVCGGAVAVREKGHGGGRGGRAGKGEAARGGGARGRARRRGHRGRPAPVQSRRRWTGTRSPRRRGSMRRRRCEGDPGRSRDGRRGTWRSWPATCSGRGRRGEGERRGGPAPSVTWSAGQGGPAKGGRRWMRGVGGGCLERRSPRCARTVPRRKGRSPGFRCCESYCSGRGGTVATRRAGQEQEREALVAGGQGRAEGRADGMRGGGRGGSAEVEEGEEGI